MRSEVPLLDRGTSLIRNSHPRGASLTRNSHPRGTSLVRNSHPPVSALRVPPRWSKEEPRERSGPVKVDLSKEDPAKPPDAASCQSPNAPPHRPLMLGFPRPPLTDRPGPLCLLFRALAAVRSFRPVLEVTSEQREMEQRDHQPHH